MFSDSSIAGDTIQAYLETEYLVFDEASTTLHIGQADPMLAALHDAYDVPCSAFITACNPFSEDCDCKSNTARLVALAVDLKLLGMTAIEGIGKHPSNNWPGEASFLVPGLSLEAAKALGTKYSQNAIVWSADNAVPRLILLR
ncbi:DUF3293 domain-containing protein [Paraburkholderia terrae]|uniref:DUF3293 domain-containing protein n=1 Tax=Paraburkholderia terrae TaxID=311230 RepID=UPI001EE23DA1|nr:DUF3293 domain-containing protein [Paraburkholderia terrae]GJH02760.1 DUF3293 domain-containing protein [Paraburkholderia terrae]